jgi:hypothetical protein
MMRPDKTYRLLRARLISLHALSYGAKFHSAPSPKAPNFILRLLRKRLEKQKCEEGKLNFQKLLTAYVKII